MPTPILVRPDSLERYAPANHSGTANVRVIGPETVGATQLEVLIGHIVPSEGAIPHAHPFLEQCAYMLDGDGVSDVGGEVERVETGMWSFLPRGALHSFRVTSPHAARVLVVYAPPYGEDPRQTVVKTSVHLQEKGPKAVRALKPREDCDAGGFFPLISRELHQAQHVEVWHVRWTSDAQFSLPPMVAEAEQVVFLTDGAARVRGPDQSSLEGRQGEFVFLPPGCDTTWQAMEGSTVAGFLIRALP